VRITTKDSADLGRKLIWFIAIYAASVLVFGAISGLLELLLPK
jgi:hypothetical protein